jgi:prepilin-type N-terminal cleavage/methylation domain-containing protein
VSRPRRAGFTLIEIIAALGILGVLGVLVSGTLSREQRVFRAATEQMDVRRSVRDAASILAEEIRGASARDTVRLLADSAIELFTSLGSSVVCSTPAPSEIALAPASSSGISITSWLAVPDTGDLALVYRAASSTPGVWERSRILGVTTRTTSASCPASTGLTAGTGVSASVYVLSIAPPAAAPLPGSPVRFIRRGRYSLYRSSDGRWYLGYRRCNAIGPSACGAIQPVSGYYRPYSTDSSRTGIFFRYLDGAGQPLGRASSPLRLARVEVTSHSLSPVSVTIDSKAKTASDSASAATALRNFP